MTPGEGRWLLRVDWTEATRALAAAEALALGARPGPAPGLFWADAPPTSGAFLLGAGEVVAAGPPGGPVTPLVEDAQAVQVPRGPWKVHGSPLDLLATLGWRARYELSSRTPTPGRPAFVLYPTLAGWWLVRTTGAPRWTEPALVRRTSTSLPSRLARAVVHLVARPGDRVVDPVCGTGVLLVEAARAGCRAVGGDLSPKAAAWARQNLRALGLEAAVEVRDALSRRDGPFDAVVGDLPYGLRLAPRDLEPFARALPRLGRRWALVANVDLSAALARHARAPRLVLQVPKSTFSRYVHVGEEPTP
ncbi:MAG: methyltransferase domain-containing protein [Planctomycetes bacterium]|nr:methyltransferase domain-containing protein [Planctomycetota bacterium]